LRNALCNGYSRQMTTLEQDSLSNQFGNGQANMGLGMTQEQQALQSAASVQNYSVNYSPSPDDAARLFFSDPAWKLRFEARCELELAKQKAEAEEMIREGQEKLAALSPSERGAKAMREFNVAKARGRAKAAAKAPKAKKAPRGNTPKNVGLAEGSALMTKALDAIDEAGTEGIGTIRLGKLLGTSAGPIVAPLVEAGKVKVKGAKRGTVYFSV